LNEKDILLNYQNCHIVNFYFSILGQNNLYLVMEFLPGGDLSSLLQNVGALDEVSAKKYTAQIVKA
jgi:serine/threonine protein kinase